MKVFIFDISGKVILYDIALCEALSKQNPKGWHIEFFCPLYKDKPKCKTTRLLNLVPLKYKNSENICKRVLKFCELLLNYLFLLIRVIKDKPDILHLQWLPLLEVSSGESFLLRLIKFFSKQTKLVFTVHNVFPHGFSVASNKKYIGRMIKVSKYIDSYITHTEETKKEVANLFIIPQEKITVVHHGIFAPNNFIPSHNTIKGNRMVFILYGNLSSYKGVDIFVNAIKSLPNTYKNKVQGIIAGEMHDKDLLNHLREESKDINLAWFPYFLPEQELFDKIDESNVIVLPYRQISQSGVLLLALYFRRYIITSDLPSFKETLTGFTDDMFFESENPQSLASLMERYVDGTVDTDKQMKIIEDLNRQYSWNSAAVKTLGLYSIL